MQEVTLEAPAWAVFCRHPDTGEEKHHGNPRDDGSVVIFLRAEDVQRCMERLTRKGYMCEPQIVNKLSVPDARALS